jgi:hypothetical protein
MAYDRDLADRIRATLADQAAVREVDMFGGLTFMVNEKLTVTANTRGDLMVRADPARVDDLIAENDAAEWAEMNGRQMSKGWLVIGAENVEDDEDLNFWVSVALDYNRKAPAKKSAPASKSVGRQKKEGSR